MKKLLFIFNEKSGRAQLKERLHSIVNFYQENNFIVTLLPIKQINCFSELLETSTVDVLVCAGGDGTLNSVLSQYMKLGCKMPVGYLPMGSTNDYARTLGYTDDFEKALQRSCLGVARTVDIGRFNDQYFVYVAAFGSLTEVSYSTSQPMKNILGHFAYILSGIQKITDIRFYHLKLHNQDQQIEGQFCMGFIMNSLSIGGFKNPLSDLVKLDDGKFEVFLIKMPRGLLELQQIVADLLVQNIHNSMFVYFQADYLEIQSEPIRWTLDGEFGGELGTVKIANCKKAVRILG